MMNLSIVPKSEVCREDIIAFESFLAGVPNAFFGDSDNCPLKHEFADGFYIRTIFIPAGTVVVGKIHRSQHPNILLKGDVSVVTEDGGRERLKAPLSMISPGGTKRVVYAHTDTLWQTIHLNPKNTRDLKELEDEIICKDYSELDCVKNGRISA